MPHRAHLPNILSAKAIADLSHWVVDKFAALHSQKTTHAQIQHLRELDHHMLWDMGIDRSALFERFPRIEPFHFEGEEPNDSETEH